MKQMYVMVIILTLYGCQAEPMVSSIDNYDDVLAAAQCERWARCGFIGASEEASCRSDAALTRLSFPAPFSFTEAVRRRSMNFQLEAARDYVSSYANWGCTEDQLKQLRAKRALAFRGALQLGAICRSDWECSVGYCDWGARGEPGCAGTCKAFLAVGTACSPTNDLCDGTSYCDPTQRRCVARSPEGATCCPDPFLAPCSGAPLCRLELACAGYVAAAPGGTDKKGRCGQPGTVGTTCSLFADGTTNCMPGLFCDRMQLPGRCADRLPAGSVCATSRACQDGLTCKGLDWSVQGAITALGVCTPFLDVTQFFCLDIDPTGISGCPQDMLCSGVGQCVYRGIADVPCLPGDCRDGLYCAPGMEICRPQAALGQPCVPPRSGADNPCYWGSCDPVKKTCALQCS